MYLLSDIRVFRGDFRLILALCAVFRGGVGYLPYLSEKKGHTRATVGFTVFTVGMVSVLQVYFQLQ